MTPEIISASEITTDMFLDTVWERRPATFANSSAFREVTAVTVAPFGVRVELSNGEVTSYAPDEEVRIARRVCNCNGGDLPLFDHHRMCDLREGVPA